MGNWSANCPARELQARAIESSRKHALCSGRVGHFICSGRLGQSTCGRRVDMCPVRASRKSCCRRNRSPRKSPVCPDNVKPPLVGCMLAEQDCTSSAAPRILHSSHPLYTGCCRTLSVETRSAVSSSVNWLIWSTMVAILGLVGAAAASDCHLRCILCCAPPTAGRAPIAGRAAQTQRLRARDTGADMLCCGFGRSM